MNQTTVDSRTPVFEMRGVAVRSLNHPTVIIAEGVNWTVKPGEFWLIGSPQHSGKTDFLLVAGGLSSPAGGEYRFLGERMPIFEVPRIAHRLKLGFVFDGGQLLGPLTVAENIALPLRYHGRLCAAEIELRVRKLLEFTGLLSWANSPPSQLGRSWQQRAGLARALALQPEALLLDSPLTGLDGRHTTWWLGMLDQLSRGHGIVGGKPVTLVVTVDDLRPWRQCGVRVACLSGRRLIVPGDWTAVQVSKERVIQELLGDLPPEE